MLEWWPYLQREVLLPREVPTEADEVRRGVEVRMRYALGCLDGLTGMLGPWGVQAAASRPHVVVVPLEDRAGVLARLPQQPLQRLGNVASRMWGLLHHVRTELVRSAWLGMTDAESEQLCLAESAAYDALRLLVGDRTVRP